jgi:uncharacterized protein
MIQDVTMPSISRKEGLVKGFLTSIVRMAQIGDEKRLGCRPTLGRDLPTFFIAGRQGVMLKPGPARKLIVTVNESDRWHGRSVYNALLELFQHKRLAGATVTRGIAGWSGHGAIQTVNVLDLSASLPVRIEVVDTPEAIDRVLPDVYDIVERGLVEIQESQVVKFAPVAAEAAGPEREERMRLVGKAKVLQIHIGADDRWEGEPLFEAIVKRARQLDLAGATVFRGVLGYGAQKRLHKHKTFALSHDDPILVSVIDTEEKIDKLLAAIDGMVTGGCLIAISDATVVKYEHHAAAGDADSKPGE